jgi:thiosulfate/3-mercaptopyruvate sulfurtransferase
MYYVSGFARSLLKSTINIITAAGGPEVSNAPSPLVSVDWLADHLNDPGVRIIDVRWKSRYENGKGISLDDPDGYRAGHIPGAVFAGMVAGLSDPTHAIPDMLAPPDLFAEAMSRLGVGDNTLVVA